MTNIRSCRNRRHAGLARVPERGLDKRWLGTTVVAMGGRYDQSDLNIYGAEDEEEMDAILDALERAVHAPEPRTALPNPTRDRKK